jgi:adenosine deaminase
MASLGWKGFKNRLPIYFWVLTRVSLSSDQNLYFDSLISHTLLARHFQFNCP